MNQPARRFDLREDMPETADWVAARRLEWGKDHVNACLRDGLKGTPGRFYAMEAGHVVGTPFPATHQVADVQTYALLLGCRFAVFMARPGETDGTH